MVDCKNLLKNVRENDDKDEIPLFELTATTSMPTSTSITWAATTTWCVSLT